MISDRLKKHRRPGGHHTGHSMPLVPMIDMLVILVVYMLLNSSDYEIVPNTKNISIPQSESAIRPRESTVMMITRDAILVNGRTVAPLATIVADDPGAVQRLRDTLAAETQKQGVRQASDRAEREVTVMADKGLPYSVLKKVMTAATAADVGKLSLAVMEKETSYRGPSPE